MIPVTMDKPPVVIKTTQSFILFYLMKCFIYKVLVILIHSLVHTHTYTHMHTHTHTYTHTYISTYTHIHTHIHTHTRIHTHVHTHIHTHIHTQTSIYNNKNKENPTEHNVLMTKTTKWLHYDT